MTYTSSTAPWLPPECTDGLCTCTSGRRCSAELDCCSDEVAYGVCLLCDHQAWKEQFDDLQIPKTEGDTALQTKMWQDTGTLVDRSHINPKVRGNIAHAFYREQDQQVSFLGFLWRAMLTCV